MLYFIGLGLGDEKDITVRGLEAVRKCKRVFLEMYTSILATPKERLEELYDKKIEVADRETVESNADLILNNAHEDDVAFLVVGDPFGATTHTDMILRAKQRGIPFSVIHNASIMNAIGCCGLQLYNYGQSVSICFFTETWRPDSFYDKIAFNVKGGLHSLCLLDIKVKEPNLDAMMRGKVVYDPPRYMTVNQAVEQLLEVSDKKRDAGETPVYDRKTIAAGLARVGQSDQRIISGTLEELLTADFGAPLHSLVLAGTMHILEIEMLASFAVNPQTFVPLLESHR
ncbi:diphthine synthase [Capsaspora owczarzaki ATCC 30864]|uniref:diphthine methyl ester synthase n=1 Tax=Capsaspora owczarzaki (strain ATCC 30864) TaxID=595528 RepID=A0A0D2X330_CAPO3|nr:diphthine synthase [Capsaspora owczarzaki ATCC 30864]KJE93594.1 diphthine synthase [Capsaspora owczarzaki ATCC 30864]|eukprot:XP_004348184.1 diphthine synthase [Capsaspora owczarzaki ATCC 30864]